MHNPSRRLRKELHPSTTPYFNTLTDTPVACRCHNITDIFLVVNDLAAHAKTKTPEPRGRQVCVKNRCATLFAAMRQFQKFHKVLCAHDNVVVREMFQISGYEFCVAKLGDFVKFFVGFICKLQF